MEQETAKLLNANGQDRENIRQHLQQYLEESGEDETDFDSESEAEDCTATCTTIFGTSCVHCQKRGKQIQNLWLSQWCRLTED